MIHHDLSGLQSKQFGHAQIIVRMMNFVLPHQTRMQAEALDIACTLGHVSATAVQREIVIHARLQLTTHSIQSVVPRGSA
ncbi:hypothetical protein SDC9_95223 [bioreactor metagenome]|uniref:Uncharacterized protein n=1 Tax=bioreactor metagenome TaxID=1076179 RepID=A0A645A718_9ZZZZ